VSRTWERPTNASPPANSSPRVKPGSSATVSTVPASRSATEIVPLPDSSTQRRSSNQRGECGIERPLSTISPVSTSIRIPPLALFSRPPPGTPVPPPPPPQRGHVAGLVIDHAEPVEMAAILRRQGRDEGRLPARDEAVLGVESGEAGEVRRDHPELSLREGHLVDADVAGEVLVAREEAGV